MVWGNAVVVVCKVNVRHNDLDTLESLISVMSSNYPYLARSTIRYKSPHPTDLSFAKDET